MDFRTSGQLCKVCTDPKKLEIERKILSGISFSQISQEYGMSIGSVSNHARNHLSRQLIKANDTKELFNSQNLARQLETLVKRTWTLLDKAEEKERLGTAVAAVRELRAHFDSMFKMAAYVREALDADAAKEAEQERQELQELSRADLELIQAGLSGSTDGRFTPSEMQLLHAILSKRPGEQLLAIKIGKVDKEEPEPPLELQSRKRRPPLGPDPF